MPCHWLAVAVGSLYGSFTLSLARRCGGFNSTSLGEEGLSLPRLAGVAADESCPIGQSVTDHGTSEHYRRETRTWQGSVWPASRRLAYIYLLNAAPGVSAVYVRLHT